MKTSEVISKINKGEAVDQDVLSDISETRVSFHEALLLGEHGFVVPQENVRYDDADIAYDADFDEVDWEEKRTSLQDVLSSKGITI